MSWSSILHLWTDFGTAPRTPIAGPALAQHWVSIMPTLVCQLPLCQSEYCANASPPVCQFQQCANAWYFQNCANAGPALCESQHWVSVGSSGLWLSRYLSIFRNITFWGSFSGQQTRNVRPMLAQCWASVVDDGRALDRHWLNKFVGYDDYL